MSILSGKSGERVRSIVLSLLANANAGENHATVKNKKADLGKQILSLSMIALLLLSAVLVPSTTIVYGMMLSQELEELQRIRELLQLEEIPYTPLTPEDSNNPVDAEFTTESLEEVLERFIEEQQQEDIVTQKNNNTSSPDSSVGTAVGAEAFAQFLAGLFTVQDAFATHTGPTVTFTTPADGSTINDNTPRLAGRNVEVDSVKVFKGPKLSAVELGTATGTDIDEACFIGGDFEHYGCWDYTHTIPFSDGTHQFFARGYDSSGNVLDTSPIVTITIDTVAPSTPTLLTPVDISTADNTPAFDWSSSTDATAVTYQLLVDNNADFSSPAISQTGLSASAFTATTALPDGTYSWKVRATDAATNVGAFSATSTFTVDTTAPDAPEITSPANNTATNDNTPTISGTAEPNSTVTLHAGGGMINGTAVIATTIANGTGSWLVSTTTLADSFYIIEAQATDAANNASPFSAPIIVKIDTVPPPAPAITSPADGTITNDNSPTVTGTADPDLVLSISNDDFSSPLGISLDSSENIYVADYGSHLVQKFAPDGAFLTSWGGFGSGNGQFDSPSDVAVDPSTGDVYVTDSNNHRVQKFTSTGVFLTSWGGFGSGNGQFDSPSAVSVDSSGDVYVTEWGNHRVQKFTSTGVFLTSWGGFGSADGQFNSPNDIAIDLSTNHAYVADYDNHRVQKFDSAGNFLTSWGSFGSGNGQFNNPTGITVDSFGDLYVIDYPVIDALQTYRLQKFTSTGTFMNQWDLSNNDPWGIAVRSSTGDVYISFSSDQLIEKFGSTVIDVFDDATHLGTINTVGGTWSFTPSSILSDGIHILTATDTDAAGNTSPASNAVDVTIDTTAPPAPHVNFPGVGGMTSSPTNDNTPTFTGIVNANFLARFGHPSGAQGSADGQLFLPQGMAVDMEGNLYVADTNNHRVQKFDSAGNFLTKWGTQGAADGQFNSPVDVALDAAGDVYVADKLNHRIQKFNNTGAFLTKWGTQGSADGQFVQPASIAIDADGTIYVLEFQGTRVQKFDSAGNFLTKWGTSGSGDGQFSFPLGIAVDSSGTFVYVADNQNHRIQKFTSSGTFVTKWGTSGSGDGQFNSPSSIDISPSGYIYVIDKANTRVQKFTDDGTFVTQWGKGYLSSPETIAFDSKGNIYIVNSGTGWVLKHEANDGNAVLEIFDGSTSLGTLITVPSGTWSFISSTPLADGTHSISAKVTDAANNLSPASFGIQITIDTVAPPAPTLISPDNNTITNDNTPTFDWTDSNATDVSLYDVTLTFSSGTAFLSQQTPDATSAFTFTAIQKDDTYKWQVRARDAAGNIGEYSEPFYITIDTIAPSAPKITSPTNSSTTSSQPTINGTLSSTFLLKFGSLGSAFGQFNVTQGVAVHPSGFVYVADFHNNRIHRVTNTGTAFSQWGSAGIGDGQFSGPDGVAINELGNRVYVTDTGNNRVQMFSNLGGFFAKWGSLGTGDGQFNHPQGIAIDSAGNVYVADSNNHPIQKFNSDGVFITKWGTFGTGNGEFDTPVGVAIDSSDNVYVTDYNNHRIQKFDSSGGFILEWGIAGSGEGEFNHPQGIAVDNSDNVFVADTGNNRVQMFTSTSSFITKWGSFGTGDGEFAGPVRIGVDLATGRLYVSEFDNHRVQKFEVIPNNAVVEIFDGATSLGTTPPSSSATWSFTPTTPLADGTHLLTAKVTDEANNVSPASAVTVITVQTLKQANLTLNDTPDVAAGTPYTVSGKLIDAETGEEITNANITFSGNGTTASLASALTSGVTFTDAATGSGTLEVVSCATNGTDPLCSPDSGAIDDGNNIVVELGLGDTITLPIHNGNTKIEHLRLLVDGTGNSTFALRITTVNGLIFEVDGFSTSTSPTQLDITHPDSISRVELISASAGFVRIAKIQTFDANGDPELQQDLDFENIAAGSKTSRFVVNDGSFFSSATAQSTPASNLVVTATFAGNSEYAAVSASEGYNVYSSTGAGLSGEADSGSIISDTGTGVTTLQCSSRDDGDFDGICSTWEASTGGVPIATGGKYNLIYTNPDTATKVAPKTNHKDVFVEVDYMQGHKPDPAALDKVRQTFAKSPLTNGDGITGVTIHLLVDEEVPHQDILQVWRDPSTSPDDLLDDFEDIKAQYFGFATNPATGRTYFGTLAEKGNDARLDAKAQVYHYVLFAHSIGTDCGPSGLAEILGNDAIVALGCDFGEADSTHAGTEGTIDEQAGTLMHELGHNFNLDHGGPRSLLSGTSVSSTDYLMQCKPNLPSVMTYARQMSYYMGADWVLDYSREALPTLDEASIVESAGLDSTAGPYKIVFGTPEQLAKFGLGDTFTDTIVKIDWDGDGGFDDVAQVLDINNFSIRGCGLADDGTTISKTIGESMIGFDEWSNLRFNFREGLTSMDGRWSDIAKLNELTPVTRLQILNQTTSISISSINTITPRWGELINITGFVDDVAPGDSVTVDWDDGTFSIGIAIDVDGTWSANHVYDSSAIATSPHGITAQLVDSTNTLKVQSTEVAVNVQKQLVDLVLNEPNDIAVNTGFTAFGRLVSNSTGEGIDGALITFNGTGVTPSLLSVTTAGVTLTDTSSVLIDACATVENPTAIPISLRTEPGPTGCTTDEGAVEDEVNSVFAMFPGSAIELPDNSTEHVRLHIQGIGDTPFVMEVTRADLTTFTVNSAGSSDSVALLDIMYSGGISKIELVSTGAVGNGTAANFVGIAKIETFDVDGDPELQRSIDFEDLTFGDHAAKLVVDLGAYFSTGTAQNVTSSDLTIQAHFAGNSLYEAADGVILTYDVYSATGAGIGEESGTIVSDTGTGITTLQCSSRDDGDFDGICSTWEASTGGVPIATGGKYNLLYTDPETGVRKAPKTNHKDVFVEIDYMQGHKPDPAALEKVRQAFANAPLSNADGITGVTVHLLVDEEVPHQDILQVWRDPEGFEDDLLDDFEDIKRQYWGFATNPATGKTYFGTLAEKGNQARLDAKAQAYHYVLFVHSIGTSCGPSGLAEILGNDAIIALGCDFTDTDSSHAGTEGTVDEQAGTLMHELGHNFNLDHGGPRALASGTSVSSTDYLMNCKPGLPSVMTYARQMPYYMGGSWVLDYSREALPTISEGSLTESDGLQSVGGPYVIVFGTPGATNSTFGNAATYVAGTVPLGIDWDGDGNADETIAVSLDVNNFTIRGCGLASDGTVSSSLGESMKGFDEWSNLKFNFREGVASIDGRWADVAKTDEMTGQTVKQMKNQTTTVSIASVNTVTPRANIDTVMINGTTDDAEPGDTVTVNWDDGSFSTDIPIDASGNWNASHVYDTSAIATNPHEITAELVDSSHTLKAQSPPVTINVQRKPATLVLNEVNDVQVNTGVTFSGKLVDAITGEPIPDAFINFTGTGVNSTTLANATTAGIAFTDSSGFVNIVACPTDNSTALAPLLSGCIPDDGALDDGDNKLVLLRTGANITLPDNSIEHVRLFVGGIGNSTFTLMVTRADVGTTFDVVSAGIEDGLVQIDLLYSKGISNIQVIGAEAGFIGLAKLQTIDSDGDPELQRNLDFEEIAEGTYDSPFVVDSESFFATSVAQSTPASDLTVQAHFAGNSEYAPTSSTIVRTHDVLAATGAGLSGEADSGSIVSDTGTGVTTLQCSSRDDGDLDGICSTWEASTGGVPISTGGKYNLIYTNPDTGAKVAPKTSHKDVFVEIDYMQGHKPDPAALQKVKDAFASAPLTNGDGISGVTVHLLVDEEVPHQDILQVWRDPSTSPDDLLDDFEDIKRQYWGFATNPATGRTFFGTPAEKGNQPRLDAKAQVYHYVLFAHSVGTDCGPSGLAEILGNDAIISLGCDFGEVDLNHAGTEGTIDEQAGTLMHELGHNFNLDHGGPRSLATGVSVSSSDYLMQCKPNLPSVMTYSRQMPYYLGGEWVLDYSREILATLDESALVEANGLSSTGGPYAIVYGIPVLSTFGTGNTTGLGIDWDGDGIVESTEQSLDINNFSIKGCGLANDGTTISTNTGESMLSFDEWSNIKFNFREGLTSIDGRWADVAKSDELTALTLEGIHSQTTSVSIGSINTVSPIASVDTVTINGTTNGANATTDRVIVDWDDGSSPSIVTIGLDGTWTASHVYDPSAIPTNPHDIVAQLVDMSTNTLKAQSTAVTVNVQKLQASLVLNNITGVAVGTGFTVSGKLVDAATGEPITDALINFTGTGVTPTLANTTTSGVRFSDNSNSVQVIACSTADGTCTVDQGADDDGNNILISLGVGGAIELPDDSIEHVRLFIDRIGNSTFTLNVTRADLGTTFDVISSGVEDSVVQIDLLYSGGISKIEVTSVGTAGFVGVSKLETIDANGDPELQRSLNFEDIAPGAYSSPLIVNSEAFFSTGVAQESPATDLTVQAHFEGNELYAPVSSEIKMYNVYAATGTGLGDGSGTIVSDTGTGVTTLQCSSRDDGDFDGICSTWEASTGGVPIATGGKYNLLYTDPETGVRKAPKTNHKDVFVEIDYMQGHKPDPAALEKVRQAFANAPLTNGDGITGVTVHLLVDEEVPHQDVLQVWRDPEGFEDELLDDFEDIKRQYWGFATNPATGKTYFGTLAEKGNQARLDAKAQAYHYVLFAHSIGTDCGPSGLAEIFGNDVIISLGCDFGDVDSIHAGSEGTIDEQAGTLMHELGHNFNLDHGGPRSLASGTIVSSTDYLMQCKPNLASVMTYSRQMPYYLGSSWLPDYSREALPTISEDSLLESDGLRSALAKYNITFGIALFPNFGVGETYTDLLANIDWDGEGDLDADVLSLDINNFSIRGCGLANDGVTVSTTLGETMIGFDEWSNLKFNFREGVASIDGRWADVAKTDEMTGQTVQQMIEQTTTVSISTINTAAPVWNETVTISGTTDDASAGDTITINWGDGTPASTGIVINSTSGAWGPVSHEYTEASLNLQPKITAELVDINNILVVQSTPITITVMPHPTLVTLDNISSVIKGSDITVTGKLVDNTSGDPLAGMTISFSGTGASGLPSVLTAPDGTFIATGPSPTVSQTGLTVQAHFAGDTAGLYGASSSDEVQYSTLEFDFAITATPGSRTIAKGQSVAYEIAVTLPPGVGPLTTGEQVSLAISGLPATGIVSTTFTPALVTPNGTSILFITTTEAVPEGTYTLAVTGTGAGVTRSDNATLIVAPITIESFTTDSKFADITSFDIVFTKDQATSSQKLTATNPGTYYYNEVITNTGTSSIVATYTLTIPASTSPALAEAFCLKGAHPVHVYSNLARTIDVTSEAIISPAQPIAVSTALELTCTDNITVSTTVPAGELRYITVHIDFAGKGSTGFASDATDTYLQSFKLIDSITIDGIPGEVEDLSTFTGTGKRVTAIGGHALDSNGDFKTGLVVKIFDGSTLVGESPVTPPDGYYFVTVPAGGPYTAKLFNPSGELSGKTVSSIDVAKDQYVPIDFLNLNPADPVVEGYVFDEETKGVGGVTVNIYRDNGGNSKLFATTTTADGGWYVFRFTQPGTYTVEAVSPDPAKFHIGPASVTVSLKQFEEVRIDFALETGAAATALIEEETVVDEQQSTNSTTTEQSTSTNSSSSEPTGTNSTETNSTSASTVPTTSNGTESTSEDDSTESAAPVTITSPTNGTVTNNNIPEIAGTAEAGSNVTIYVDGVETADNSTADAAGEWSIELSAALTDGNHEITAHAESGETTQVSDPVTIIIDRVSPTGSVEINSGEAYTSLTLVTLTLACEDANGCAEMRVAADGVLDNETFEAFAPSIELGLPKDDGEKLVAVEFKDTAGNISPSFTDTIILDTAAPEAPEIADPQDGATLTTAAPEDDAASFTISGTAEAGSLIEVFNGNVSLGAVLADDETGEWSLEVTLEIGSYSIVAAATDGAGNVSPISDSISISIEQIQQQETPSDSASSTNSTSTEESAAS